MNLVIVESPTKARKLRSYLSNEYIIEASVGHIRDLPKGKMGVDVEHNFEPTYEISEDKKKVIALLKKNAKNADIIYLATDPDREGEAIAWHLSQSLGDIKKEKFKRATFHEITKSAVLEAINNPSQLKMDLVDAQQARRVVDRLVGYEVSPVLWKKIRRGLSAGRVQSVALRLIVEREREIAAFIPEEYWEVDVALSKLGVGAQAGTGSQAATGSSTGAPGATNAPAGIQIFVEGKPLEELPDGVFVARVIEVNKKKYEPTTEADVTPIVAELDHANYKIAAVERKERTRSSLPPFTTSTLQQAAANRLGMSSKQTMRIAQDMYEEGLITYHRTDAVALSQSSLDMARAYIQKQFGPQYLLDKPRHFANKSKNAQEAHEAVRVTDVNLQAGGIMALGGKMSERHVKLYDLIWRRFLASQLPNAVYDQTTVTVEAKMSTGTATLRTSGSILKFDGWLKLFPDREDTILPALEAGEAVDFLSKNSAQKFTQPPPRFNDASLVKQLEQQGIGRPSTYASIISVIEDRGYVERDAKRFVATAIGMTVSDFLLQHFQVFMEYQFTAEMEEDLDRISRGEKNWVKVVADFYKPFHEKIAAAADVDRAQIPVEKTGEKCPKCGDTEGAHGEIVIRTGKYGKFKSCNRYPECDFTENIVEKVEGVVCPLCQKGEVTVKKSRWGKGFFGCSRYPECNWASWQKPAPGTIVTAEEWKVLQELRAERKKARDLKYPPKAVPAKAATKSATKKTAFKKAAKPAKKAK